MADPVYVALDFETADYQPDSACAVGLAKVRGGEVVDTLYSLIRPPRRRALHVLPRHHVEGRAGQPHVFGILAADGVVSARRYASCRAQRPF